MKSFRARRVLRADRRGSSWPVVVETDAGLFHTKLRGAAQAPASLIAEIVVAEIAEAVGLQVPDRVFIEMPLRVPVDDPHEELTQLLRGSVGCNLGFAYLDDARVFRPTDVRRLDTSLASTIFWLDGLVQNPDRTANNPNLLWSRGRLWLIDHGASLGFQHRWEDVTEDSPRVPGWPPRDDHIMRARATALALVDATLFAAVTREVLQAAVDAVPDDYFRGVDTWRRRAAYVAFLWKRLKEPRGWAGPSG